MPETSPVRKFRRIRTPDSVGGVGAAVRPGAAVAAAPLLVHRAVAGPPAEPEARGPEIPRAAPGAVVLEPAVGPVRLPGVERDVVELADRQVVEVVPVVGPVVRDVEPAVAAEDHVAAVPG